MHRSKKKQKTKIAKKHVKISIKRKIYNFYNRFCFVIKCTLVIGIFLLFFTDYFISYKKKLIDNINDILAENNFNLQKILIIGNKNISKEIIYKAIQESNISQKNISNNNINHFSIFSFPLSKIRKILLNNPWIQDIAIVRNLPNKIIIIVKEHKPLAIWQINSKLFFIDENGNKIIETTKNKDNLLHIIGGNANIHAKTLIEDLKKHDKLYQDIKYVKRIGQRRWDIILKQNIIIQMPEKNFLEAYAYLNKIYNDNNFLKQNYKIIDLRNNEKFYIK